MIETGPDAGKRPTAEKKQSIPGVILLDILILSLVFSGAIIFATWPIMSAGLDQYPLTADGLGHLTKVKYLSDSVKRLYWPQWFPYWYSGSTVVQYYPPLSFVLLIPVQMIFDNPMVTFKFLVFSSQFIGAWGVWALARHRIGRFEAAAGGLLYAIHPYFLRALLFGGVIAQWPIFAITPWFLLSILQYVENRSPSAWLRISLLTALLVLSQPMHAYMICVIFGFLVLMLYITKIIHLERLVMTAVAIGLGGGLTSVWALPGVTGIETPGIPYLLPEASWVLAAWPAWFWPSTARTGNFYFSIALLILAALSILTLVDYRSRVGTITAFYLTLALSIALAFGQRFPLYRLLPMGKSLIAGRFLSVAALMSILLALHTLQYILWLLSKHSGKFVCGLVALMITAAIAVDINPRLMPLRTDSLADLRELVDSVPSNGQPFGQGRFSWVLDVPSEISYFPMLRGFSMTDGWNIEGTPHNRAIWLHNIALTEGKPEYVIRNLLQWNTRSVLIDSRYTALRDALQNQGFRVVAEKLGITALHSSAPSSYVLKKERNSIVIGNAASRFMLNFPWFAHGHSAYVEDYSIQSLSDFNLVYIIEPKYRDIKTFQEKIALLIDSGKVVFIEWGRSEILPLWNTMPYWDTIRPGASLSLLVDGKPAMPVTFASAPGWQVPFIDGLNPLVEISNGDLKCTVIGSSTVAGRRLYFTGLALSQLLDTEQGPELRRVMEQVFVTLADPHRRITPTAFEVGGLRAWYNGISFRYSCDQDTPVIISIKSSPRWRAYVDGVRWSLGETEHLLTIDLPAGDHEVTLRYGVIWLTWVGTGLSALTVGLTLCLYTWLRSSWTKLGEGTSQSQNLA